MPTTTLARWAFTIYSFGDGPYGEPYAKVSSFTMLCDDCLTDMVGNDHRMSIFNGTDFGGWWGDFHRYTAYYMEAQLKAQGHRCHDCYTYGNRDDREDSEA